ncbi:MAG: S9 family peptidase [Deltaproteobacteria bacterium]|nr:S9 family peptidase [Deltaproteobacteria bacterium]MDQ3296806.1 S9 family peptidase [Myxococcota bacterium]
MKLQLALLGVALTLGMPSADAKGLTVDDMLAMQRISDPNVSPDGKWVAFAVRDTDLDANRGRMDLWLASVDGVTVRRLTTHPENDTDPRWSPDGKSIYFMSSRSGSSQVWRIAIAGGEAEQVTKLPLDLNGFELFPDGKRLVVPIDVWPDAKTLAETVKRDEAKEKSKSKARVYDQLLFRHWDQWEDGKYSHVFVWTPPELGGKADDARDLTPGQTTDSPTHPFGGMEEIAISPDGKTVAFVARQGGRETAWQTNTDVFLVPAAGGAKPVALTAANKAYDFEPTFSPDGRSLAVRRMVRAGFEADRERIAVYDLASRKERIVTEAWDRSASSLTWSADGKTIYTSADNVGNHSLFAVDVASGQAKVIVDKGTNASPRLAGDRLVFARDTLKSPVELYSVKPDGSDLRPVTRFNEARVKRITWGDYEQFSFKGAKGDTVYGYAMKPAGFKGGKAPVAMLIHGGPQGSFGDHWHYRWNPQAYAGRGYGVVFIDFHGSTGYGQAFTDAIRGDWGGAPYEDLMLGLDAALAKFPWLDKTRMAALGASYGGYMINWLHGKTDRFKALVCHDGNLDERMAYFDTEELWFPEWEHGGPPWENPAGYTKHNPIDFVKNWKTPTLVIHGALDFRVVDTQGMSTFTALQRKGVPSRFLHFPDENHWILKPQNSKVWHDEVLGWLDRWTKR